MGIAHFRMWLAITASVAAVVTFLGSSPASTADTPPSCEIFTGVSDPTVSNAYNDAVYRAKLGKAPARNDS